MGSSKNQSQQAKDESLESRSIDAGNKLVVSVENDESTSHNFGNEDADNGLGKSSRKLTYNKSHKTKKVCPKTKGSRYPLRSSKDGIRVLRSMSNGKSTPPTSKSSVPTESGSTPVNPAKRIKRKKKQINKTSDDEFLRIRKRVRYILTRMNYEQSLLDAYSGDGWKGQSLEKIRPEKELERAKSEILRCKMKIRDLFRHLDALLSEGKLEESLFDDEGEISSEDILCGKCGLMEVSADNDIILCDGACDRGFHQKCLDPPLLTEDIPSDDIGWLCPACDCKVDCINFLNEIQGSDLSVEDMWERVFPEAAATVNGDKQFDDMGLPSDDSEDDDFNPDAPDIDVENEKEGSSSEESSSEESYYTCSSEDSDSGVPNPDKHSDTLGLPSDDSEDDDYDPDGPDPEEVVQKDVSNLEESDFTSDSDEFMEEINKASDINEASGSSILNPLDLSGEDRQSEDKSKLPTNTDLLPVLDHDMNEENLMLSGKRQRESLDYKKLYDETYGEASSDSSDEDDDWSDVTLLKKAKKVDAKESSVALPKAKVPRVVKNKRKAPEKLDSSAANLLEIKEHNDSLEPVSNRKGSTRERLGRAASQANTSKTSNSKREFLETKTEVGGHLDQSAVPRDVSSRRKAPETVDSDAATFQAAAEHTLSPEPVSSEKGSRYEKLVKVTTQRLLESFKENQYPDAKAKEKLAEELGKTVRQVTKWFENARRSARVVAEEAGQAGFSTPTKSVDASKTDINSAKRTPSTRGNRSCGETSNHTGNSESGVDNSNSNGGNAKNQIADAKRQKAIAQELRKRKKSR